MYSIAGIKTASGTGKKGVISRTGQDCLLLFITLDKKYTNITYEDHLQGSTLFWSGQNNQRYAERYVSDGEHDVFVFIKDATKKPYIYYGRAMLLRMLYNEPGTPSKLVFDLYEYGQKQNLCYNSLEVVQFEPEYSAEAKIVATEDSRLQKIRIAQGKYRRDSLALWNNRCAVTGVDESSWLIASHIKPWREATDSERINANNSLVLTPNLDKLFDRGVISFSHEDGKVILPESVSFQMWKNMEKMGIKEETKLVKVPEETKQFLLYHKEYVFGFKPSDNISDSEVIESLVAKVSC